MDSNHKQDRKAPGGGGSGKKRYEPPEILFHEPLEAIAATCQQQGGKERGNPACNLGPINS